MTRALLVEAADAVLSERGYREATVSEIAERAGYSRGAVYSNFEDKDDLALAIVERRIWLVCELLRSAPDAGGDPVGEAEDLATRVAELMSADQVWARLFLEFAVHASRRPELARRLRAAYRTLTTTLSEVVSRAARFRGLLLTMPADRLSLVLLAAADGAALERLIDPERADSGLLGDIVGLLVQGALVED